MGKNKYEAVILNAPDPDIFNPKHDESFHGRKIRLIANSWSSNIRKGFDIYQFLDEHLDFNKYEMTFVGNSPIEFKNIKWLKPVPSQGVADILKEHDIYIMASINDACSNGLIEALSCGLPAVGINDGGNPEILGKAGELFEDERGAIEAIDRVAQNYGQYPQRISLPTLDEIGQKYYRFARNIYEDYLSGAYKPKRIKLLNIMKPGRLLGEIIRWKVLNKFRALARRSIAADFYSRSLHRGLLEREIKKINLSGLTLDIGSKNRRYDDYFPDARIIAIDIEPQLEGGSIIQCDARNICFRDNSFDNVISFETLEYIYQTEDVLKEIKRVLKPGGTCYFSVPFLNPVHGGTGDIVRYTKRGWQELLQKYFDKVEIKAFGGRYPLIFDFWFDKVRKSGTFKKLVFLPLALLLRKISLVLNKKEAPERFVMGYLMTVQK
jgi:SAM-dependent methyltransferase